MVLSRLPDMWTDEMLALWVPVAMYWVLCLCYEGLMRWQLPYFEQFRLHTAKAKDTRNKVTLTRVIIMVALQHVVQLFFGYFLMHVQPADVRRANHVIALTRTARAIALYGLDPALSHHIASIYLNLLVPLFQFVVAMMIIDTHQYFLHRLAHTSTFLYKHFHSHHHRLYVPYAFGALYNHPVEGFALDTLGAALAYELTRMTPRMGMLLFCFSNIKTINDHCGYSFPWDPLNVLFKNNGVYHDIHHQAWGIKKNFAQPFFTFWDRVLDTQMDEAEVKRRTKVA